MAKAVGIDLETTNSVVAVYAGGHPAVIANTERAADPAGHRCAHRTRGR
jgi:molecular chaperone DnaK (HSP70)